MHPATMEWLIIQTSASIVDRPLTEKSLSFKRLAEELAPAFHESIINLHLKKMESRGLLYLQQDASNGTSEKVNNPNTDTIIFLAKIDTLFDIKPSR